MKVTIATFDLAHHGAHSGYGQLKRHLDAERVEVSRLPRIPSRLRRRLVVGTNMPWYDEWSLALELVTARRLARGRLCHFLYGEDACCYVSWARVLAGVRGGRLVATFHQPPSTFDAVYGRPRFLRRLDAAVALCREQAEHLEALGSQHVRVVPHGVDTTFYSPGTAPPNDRFVCLFVGSWLRDVGTLKAVVARLPDVAFEAVTSPENLAALEGLPNVAGRTGLTDEELRDAYRRADLLVLPLLDSTANNALLEALACGLPIVTTDVGGVGEYVDASCAVITPPWDADAIAGAVVGLAGDATRRAGMAAAARRRALQFDWARVADRIRRLYEEIS